jgi:hypothetical protein
LVPIRRGGSFCFEIQASGDTQNRPVVDT